MSSPETTITNLDYEISENVGEGLAKRIFAAFQLKNKMIELLCKSKECVPRENTKKDFCPTQETCAKCAEKYYEALALEEIKK